MAFDKNEIIVKLKQELEILDKGGYAPTAPEPHWAPRVFRDSVSCPNLGLHLKVEPCSNCFLMYFVPVEHRDKENACQYIPLNQKGDTVQELSREGYQALEPALRSWLQEAICRLEKEPDFSILEAEPERLLLPGGG